MVLFEVLSGCQKWHRQKPQVAIKNGTIQSHSQNGLHCRTILNCTAESTVWLSKKAPLKAHLAVKNDTAKGPFGCQTSITRLFGCSCAGKTFLTKYQNE